jgi:hypothetical protein
VDAPHYKSYQAARDRAAKAWQRLDEAWQRGEQGTQDGWVALDELNSALSDAALAYDRYVDSFANRSANPS